jgi:hypothetical protein
VPIATLDAQASFDAAQDRPRPTPTLVWAPKPTSTLAYTPPQKPWVTLAEVKARHARDTNWRDVIVDDGRLVSTWRRPPAPEPIE